MELSHLSSSDNCLELSASKSLNRYQESLEEIQSVFVHTVGTDSLIEGCQTRSSDDNERTFKDLAFVHKSEKAVDEVIDREIGSK